MIRRPPRSPLFPHTTLCRSVEVGITMTRERLRKSVTAKAELAAVERVLAGLVGTSASPETRQKFRKLLREGALAEDRKSTRLNSSHRQNSYAVFCLTL